MLAALLWSVCISDIRVRRDCRGGKCHLRVLQAVLPPPVVSATAVLNSEGRTEVALPVLVFDAHHDAKKRCARCRGSSEILAAWKVAVSLSYENSKESMKKSTQEEEQPGKAEPEKEQQQLGGALEMLFKRNEPCVLAAAHGEQLLAPAEYPARLAEEEAEEEVDDEAGEPSVDLVRESLLRMGSVIPQSFYKRVIYEYVEVAHQ